MKTILKNLTIIMAAMLCAFTANAQTLSGTVTDTDNKPIKGVKVYAENRENRAVHTDAKGAYSVTAGKGETVIFSHPDYETAKRRVSSSVMNVTLERVKLELCVEMAECDAAVMKNLTYTSVQRMPMISYEYSTEEYTAYRENRFIPAAKEPLSTFSLDVNTASYSNVRRMINSGKLPDNDAVRIEELINYFSYDYPKPTGKDPLRISYELGDCPWNTKHKLVKLGIKAKEIPSDDLPPSNFVFLIDVSGSMYSRLDMVKSSMKLLTNNLRDNDRVAIVTYAGNAGLTLESTPGSDKQKIKDALDALQASGSTAGGEGIKLAYKIARQNFMEGGNNRIILCTDGDFNVGVSSMDELERLIENERKSGVFLTVLGYGMGNYKDNRMQLLAEKGNGNYAYIDNMQEANKVLINEFGSTMYTVAKDVKVQVEFNPALVQSYRLVGYESRLLNSEDFNDDTKDAGELGAGHMVTVFYEIVPAGTEGAPGSIDPLKYQSAPKPTNTGNTDELMYVKLRYKDPDKDASKKMEVAVKNRNTKLSDDFNFAAAVAMFGQLLKDSDFKGDADYDKVIALARRSLGDDPNGYRREFVRLAETAKGLSMK